MVELPDLTPEQEIELASRIAQRGDLHLLGLPVSQMSDLYKVVQEWRAKGGQQRWIDDLIEREKLTNSLIDLLDAVDGVHVYPEGSFGFEELAAAQQRCEALLNELGYKETAQGWQRA